MRRSTWILAVAFASSAAWADPAPAAGERVEAKLGADSVYFGETVDYEVLVVNVESAGAPDLSAFTDFEVEDTGSSGFEFSNRRFDNGRMVQDVQKGKRYGYRLKPKRAGSLAVPAPRVLAAGRTIEGRPLTLRVIEPKKQDLVVIAPAVERKGRYPLQPFTLRLKIFVRRLPPPRDDIDPLADAVEPSLQIPWLDAPEGLEAGSYSDWLSPLRSTRHNGRSAVGFSINNLTFQEADVFGFPTRSRLAAFDLGGRLAKPEDVAGIAALEGRASDYVVYALERKFVPQRAGTFEFEGISVRGRFPTGISGASEPVFDVGPPLAVEVDEPPQKGRPPSWSGAIGSRWTVRSDLLPRRARVGDPMTLTVTVNGDGNVGAADAPLLAELPEFSQRFKIEAPTAETVGPERVFTFSVRPLDEAVAEVPAVPFAYFDLEKDRYAVVVSEPIPIEVEGIATLGDADIVRAAGARTGRELTRAEGLFGNVTDAARVTDDRVDLGRAALACGALAGLYAAIALWVGRRRAAIGDPRAVRQKTAEARARQRLAAAAQALAGGEPRAAAEGLLAAFAGLAADAAGIEAGGMTARDVERALAELGAGEGARQPVARLLDECDALLYGGAAPAAFAADAENALKGALAELKRLRRLP